MVEDAYFLKTYIRNILGVVPWTRLEDRLVECVGVRQ